VSAAFLAFDLGAESGRAMLGRLRSGVLSLAEIHRFPNEPIRERASLRWDLPRLCGEMDRALAHAASDASDLASIGVDSWGCDYGLLDADGALLSNPYHYRDARTDGVMEGVLARLPRSRIYGVTGIQFLPFNTIFQLAAARRRTPGELAAAKSFGTIPDILNHRLTGVLRSEFTNATTTQMVDARSRTWAVDLLRELDLPVGVLPPIVEPGTVIGKLQSSICHPLAGTPVVAPACHDTGSAVAAVAASRTHAYLSSGTWSLLGVEVPQPVITPQALAANVTNEGGVAGTTRLLRNIGGLWPLQECRRAWASEGRDYTYPELMAAASDETYAFLSLFDPDDPRFLHPADMRHAIADYCRGTGQRQPDTPGAHARAILESLAFKYRVVLETLEQLTGDPITQIQIIGGGSRNRLLNQFTAAATGRTVIAGPVEATALGNIVVQMVATGAVASIADARRIIEHSFPTDRVEPVDADRWDAHYARFKQYMELACA
jgi:rhamnulokinase